MKKLFLVDVSSMFFRAFYAIPLLTNPKGMPTNALYGFLSMTIKLLRELKPDYLAFCFDREGPSFRADLYPEYKAHRKEMPEELVPQIPYVRKLTEVLGIPILDQAGFEADDIIGTLTRKGRDHGLEVIIVSGDKDFAQLVSNFVSMHDTMKNVVYDSQKVNDKWGVEPHQMIDYLALVGDSSDNIPGVKGIGPKGAIRLLAEFKTLDGIYQNIDKISAQALKRKLSENKEMAYLSKKLVTIVDNIELGVEPEDLRLKPIDKEKLREALTELGFKSFEKNLLSEGTPKEMEMGSVGESDQSLEVQSREVVSSKANSQPRSVSAAKGKSGFLWREEHWTLQDLQAKVGPYSQIWGVLTDRGLLIGSGRRCGYVEGNDLEIGSLLNVKCLKWKGFDLKEVFRSLSLDHPVVDGDGMLAAYVVHPGRMESFDELYQRYMGKTLPDLASPAQIMTCHTDLERVLSQKLEEMDGEGIYHRLELPLVPVLYEMERKGIQIDVNELSRQSELLAVDLVQLESEIHQAAGESFNIGSPKQLAEILFVKMGIPAGKKTKSGYSTASEVIEKLAPQYPICGLVLKYRELAKLKSTYVDALPQLVVKGTQRVHTHFRQAATTTGRLSSVNPNLQNIPIRTERGRLVRKAFVAEEGKVFISADYSQIELRVLAHVSGDEGLIKAFQEDVDIHSATAAEIFSVSLREITPEFRRRAKAVNFGIAYGQGVYGLAEGLGISRSEAAAIIQRYFERFKKVKEYMSATVEEAKQRGFVQTIFGRRRYIEELKSPRPAIRAFGERAAINAPIQGTASDLVKMAMIQIYQEIEVPMVLQVHDELLFESPADMAEEQSLEIQRVMENIAQLKVPLKVNLAMGRNWEDAHA